MQGDSLHHGQGFEDPTAINPASNPTLFRTLFGLFLLLCAFNFVVYLWEVKWGAKTVDQVSLMEEGAQPTNPRWGWKPFTLEYRLYLDRGYRVEWMDQPSFAKVRNWLGDFAPFFELFILRLYGVMCFMPQVLLVMAFGLSQGSVRYHNKRFRFEHVSSTINNASIKILFWGVPLTLLWASFPFGIELPLLGEIPILVSAPRLGVIWLSSPLLGACFSGFLFSFLAFLLGANFSREI